MANRSLANSSLERMTKANVEELPQCQLFKISAESAETGAGLILDHPQFISPLCKVEVKPAPIMIELLVLPNALCLHHYIMLNEALSNIY